MEKKLKFIDFETLKKDCCPDSFQILENELNLILDLLIEEKLTATTSGTNTSGVNTKMKSTSGANIKFIRYDDINSEVICKDAKNIIDDFVDINPIVPALKNRAPISLSFILKKNRIKK